MDGWNVDWCLEDRELRLSREAEKQEEIDFFLQKLRNIFTGYPHFGVPREPTPVRLHFGDGEIAKLVKAFGW